MASQLIATYDPKKVVSAFSSPIGALVATGFASGSMVTFEKNSDLVVPDIGTTGNVVYAVNNDLTYTATIRLQQHHPDVAYFERLKVLTVSGALAIIGLVVYDPTAYDQLQAAQGMMLTDASHDWAMEEGVREYTFHLTNGVTPPKAAVDALNFLGVLGG